jgi:hypothetical protein
MDQRSFLYRERPAGNIKGSKDSNLGSRNSIQGFKVGVIRV